MLGRGVGRIRGAESALHDIECADGLVWYDETGSNGVLERRKVLLWSSMGLGKVDELVKLGVLERGS